MNKGYFQSCLWQNFVAAIKMLQAAVEHCPEVEWHADKRFFYLTYHTVIFLDYYLTRPVSDFKPYLPYTLVSEQNMPQDAVDDVIPDRWYRREEVNAYLNQIKSKCRNLILNTPEEDFNNPWINQAEIPLHGLCPGLVENYSLLEILFYNFRHLQHHIGQLNMMLRQRNNQAPGWISLAD